MECGEVVAEGVLMPDVFGTWAAQVFAICSAIICLEMLGLAFVTPLLRTKRNVWLNPEDAQRFSGAVSDVEHPEVARAVRAHRNQLENVVPFFVLGALWIGSGASTNVGVVLFMVFTAARTAHALFYLTRMGRLRTASHTVGFLVLSILVVGVIWRSLVGR